MRSQFDGRTEFIQVDDAVLGVSIALFTTPRRCRVDPVTCLAKSRNGPQMVLFVDLD